MSDVLDCAIIGGGPAGLSAAIALRALGASVIVLDREPALGGVPRMSHHNGFGLLDLHRLSDGPTYARRLIDRAVRAGAELRPGATVTDGSLSEGLRITSGRGREVVRARSILVATGCRERPRSARMVPGTRPAGVLTTGSLQHLVAGGRGRIGHAAVVVGAEYVSCSAVLTLLSAGCTVESIVSEHTRSASWPGVLGALRARYRIPIAMAHRVARINGSERVESVDLEDIATGNVRRVRCDTVVFTGDWVPDSEVSRFLGLDLANRWKGPCTDDHGRTSCDGVFAAGNVLHGALTADRCALEGRRTASTIARWLEAPGSSPPTEQLIVEEPFSWVTPSRTGGQAPLVVGVGSEVLGRVRVVVRQGERVLLRTGPKRVVPGLAITLSGRWDGLPVTGEGPIIVCAQGIAG